MQANPEWSLQAYLVGGAVRDQLLGLALTDQDWVVIGSTPKAMMALGFQPVGKDFPVFLHPITHEEYALARLERKTQAGHQGFTFEFSPSVTLDEDLARRDLTINAMAQSKTGQIIDPYGGQQDLNQRILRHVSPAFREDPLRVLRVARFAARFYHLGFSIAPETLALMQDMVSTGELATLSAERLWREWVLSLETAHPEHFILILNQVGALAALLPLWDKIAEPRSQEMLRLLKITTLHTTNTNLRFAAWLTPLENQADLGQAFFKGFCERLRPPKAYEQLAKLGMKHASTLQETINSAQGALDFFYSVDAYRAPERFQALLELASYQAQMKKTNTFPTWAHSLKTAFRATQEVKSQPFLEQGLSGLALRAAIDAEKIRVIEQNFSHRSAHEQ